MFSLVTVINRTTINIPSLFYFEIENKTSLQCLSQIKTSASGKAFRPGYFKDSLAAQPEQRDTPSYSRRERRASIVAVVASSLTDEENPGSGALTSPGPRRPASHGESTEITDGRFTRCPDEPSTRAPTCDVTFRETKLSRGERARDSLGPAEITSRRHFSFSIPLFFISSSALVNSLSDQRKGIAANPRESQTGPAKGARRAGTLRGAGKRSLISRSRVSGAAVFHLGPRPTRVTLRRFVCVSFLQINSS